MPSEKHSHSRLQGIFLRVLGLFVREKQLFEIPIITYKMICLRASCFGLGGRGILVVGNDAENVIFDPDAVIDQGA